VFSGVCQPFADPLLKGAKYQSTANYCTSEKLPVLKRFPAVPRQMSGKFAYTDLIGEELCPGALKGYKLLLGDNSPLMVRIMN